MLSEVEQEQRLSRNGDREAIVVKAGLCGGEGEPVYISYAPHYDSQSTWGKQRTFSTRLTKFDPSKKASINSTAFHLIPAIRSKGSTSVFSTRKIRPIYSHPTLIGSTPGYILRLAWLKSVCVNNYENSSTPVPVSAWTQNLKSEELKNTRIILWHYLINNGSTLHKSDNYQQISVNQLVASLRSLTNLCGIVNC